MAAAETISWVSVRPLSQLSTAMQLSPILLLAFHQNPKPNLVKIAYAGHAKLALIGSNKNK